MDIAVKAKALADGMHCEECAKQRRKVWIIVSIVGFLTLASFSAFAQQPDPATLQRTIAILQSQRNQIMDALASTELRVATLAEDLAKAQARIKELEPKPEAKHD